jgi:hypothetical protein
MTERDQGQNTEPEKTTAYFMAHHSKSEHSIYGVVPQVLAQVLDRFDYVDGFSIGGSYANGRYRDADDIDVDLLLGINLDVLSMELISREIQRMAGSSGLELHIRASLATIAIPEHMRVTLYEDHPDTPFVVRNQRVADAWGLK